MPLGLHNIALRASPGCQILTVVFVYAKFARPCRILRVSNFVAAANYSSCQILKRAAAAFSYKSALGLRSKFEKAGKI
jgi:hypothetical protein